MICASCEGAGVICVGEYTERVSREMAMDAGMPDLEGAPFSTQYIWDQCPCCMGEPWQCYQCSEEAEINDSWCW